MAGAVALQCHQYRRPTRCGRRHTGSNTFCLSFSAMRRYSAERDRQTERERRGVWARKVSGELGSGRALKTMRPHLLPSPPIYYHLQERFIACVRACCFDYPCHCCTATVRFGLGYLIVLDRPLRPFSSQKFLGQKLLDRLTTN